MEEIGNFELEEEGKFLGIPLKQGKVDINKMKTRIRNAGIEANKMICSTFAPIANRRIYEAKVMGILNFFWPAMLMTW